MDASACRRIRAWASAAKPSQLRRKANGPAEVLNRGHTGVFLLQITRSATQTPNMLSVALESNGSPKKRTFSRGISEDESLRSIIKEVSEEMSPSRFNVSSTFLCHNGNMITNTTRASSGCLRRKRQSWNNSCRLWLTPLTDRQTLPGLMLS